MASVKVSIKRSSDFMDRSMQIRNNKKCEKGLRLNLNNHKFAVPHHNVKKFIK
jgi:hypothetical protein